MGKPSAVVVSIPGVCGGHAILKGHRIEVSNILKDLHCNLWTPEDWIAEFGADGWLTPAEILEALTYCRNKQCLGDGLTCCHCALNPEEGSDPDDKPVDGWRLAGETLERLRNR